MLPYFKLAGTGKQAIWMKQAAIWTRASTQAALHLTKNHSQDKPYKESRITPKTKALDQGFRCRENKE